MPWAEILFRILKKNNTKNINVISATGDCKQLFFCPSFFSEAVTGLCISIAVDVHKRPEEVHKATIFFLTSKVSNIWKNYLFYGNYTLFASILPHLILTCWLNLCLCHFETLGARACGFSSSLCRTISYFKSTLSKGNQGVNLSSFV